MGVDYGEFKNVLQMLSDSQSCAESKCEFKDHHVSVVTDSHPLQCLLDEKSCVTPFILISDTLTVHSEVPVRVEVTSPQKPDMSMESLEGSPLKLQTFSTGTWEKCVTRTETNQVVRGVSAAEAQWLVGMYMQAARELVPSIPVMPLWVMCDGSGSESLAYLGTHLVADTEGDTCTVNVYNVTHKEGVKKADLPHAGPVLHEHKWRAASNKVEVACTAEYDVFGTFSLDDSLQVEQTSIIIKLNWQDMRGLLGPPTQDATAFIELGIVAGNLKSVARGLYGELEALKGFACGLDDGVIQWNQEKANEALMTDLQKFIEVMSHGDMLCKTSQAKEEETDEAKQKSLLPDRVDLDFTEQLWNILKGVSSYQELCDCLHHTLTSLQQGLLQPMVHKNNKSQLAQLVRDSYYGKLVIPRLNNTLPIELVAEIGIEKLLRDYMNALISKDLVTENHLQFFSRRRGKLAEQIELLERLHYCLEVVVLLEQQFKLPQTTISASARHVLKHYEEHEVSVKHVFKLPVQTVNIMGFIERCHPYHWQCVCRSHQDGADVVTAHTLSNKSPFQHIDTQLNTSLSDDGDVWRYYWTAVEQTRDSL